MPTTIHSNGSKWAGQEPAAYIVKACNAYPELVAALKACARALNEAGDAGLPLPETLEDAVALLQDSGSVTFAA